MLTKTELSLSSLPSSACEFSSSSLSFFKLAATFPSNISSFKVESKRDRGKRIYLHGSHFYSGRESLPLPLKPYWLGLSQMHIFIPITAEAEWADQTGLDQSQFIKDYCSQPALLETKLMTKKIRALLAGTRRE